MKTRHNLAQQGSHARNLGREREPGRVEEEVSEIVKMMIEGRWIIGKSHRALAVKWGVTPSAVRQRAAEASRQIAFASSQDPEAIRGMMIAEVARIGRSARIGTKEVSAGEAGIVKIRQPNHAAGIAAIRLQAELWRVGGASGQPQDWSALPPEAQLQRIADARAQLDALEQNIRASMATPADGTEETR